MVVGANTMAVGICIREEPGLEHWIGRGLNAWDKVGRAESNLLNFGEVVDGVLVENELTNLATRELLLRPNVCKIENVDLLLLPKLFSLFRGHGLDLNSPFWVVATLDGFVEILLGVVWGIIGRVFLSDVSGSLLRLHVDLSVDPFTVLVDEFHRVAGVAMHETVAIRNATVAHEDHDLMDRLRVLGKVVPERSRIIGMSQVRRRISLLGVDEVRELGGVSQEEDRSVVCHMIPIALLSSELDGKASGVSSAVVGSRFATHGRKPNSDRTLLSLGGE